MTCQHCQTWILDDDHRCRRCGRRIRNTPSRVSPATYPIAATATAPAYDFYPEDEAEQSPQLKVVSSPAQQALFTGAAPDSRVIPFDSLTTEAGRRSIQARFAGIIRPAPFSAEKVEVRRARANKNGSATQRHLELFGQEEVLSQPQSNIICDAPVAPAALRIQAGLIDASLMGAGCAVAALVFRLCTGGGFVLDKHVLPFLAAALITIPLFYRLLWAFAGRDSLGMRLTGLRLVDFDGNPPSQERRYHRIFGSILSVLAAGMGIAWSFVDQDCLSWHDHISSTFPTVISES